jgi:endonuclease YncB( thermonuclease family)
VHNRPAKSPEANVNRALRFVTTVVALVTCGGVGAAASPQLVGRVRHVVDGDTLVVVLDSGTIEVRFADVDAPEHDQPGGAAATQALARRLGRNVEIALEPVKQDDYGRIVAVPYLGDENLEHWLLREGHAWAYRHYAQDGRLCRWEEEARRARRGLWAATAPAPVAPWDWRHRRAAIDAGRYRPTARGVEECLAALRRAALRRSAPGTVSTEPPASMRAPAR